MIVAIDIGAHGALALLDENGALVAIEDMPSIQEGRQGRLATNAPLLVDLLRRWRPSRAVVEFVASKPTDSPVSAFQFGRARGTVEACLAAHGLPIAFLTPQTWKRWAGVPPGKENKDTARAIAIARFPAQAHLFARKTDIDRAEATLLGLCGLHRESAQPLTRA